MAEISASENNGSKKRSHKLSTKIDMTPMVDLGFLLITFFMLTTTLAKPVVMQLNMPDQDGQKSEVRCSESLTVVLDDQNRIFYYQGLACDPKVRSTDFSDRGIRQVLFDYKRKIGDNFTVVIKSTNKAKYRNMIDLLDEMKITNNRRYAIVNITSEDEKLLSIK
ncbi:MULTISPECIES: biopolymer transporter ExbD [unclassified Arcicella]|uniref:ExbD/TolR family protein n=1 Tax=unclassified Arcicella TaxID=2644986 RepID=UPI00285F7211|nr:MULTISPECIES: biopolymer transporter ExbD [unclassified Arcicella]MDR6560835.1 biopolymer transport protein ExbD [Arcicella sp. BE51]MDR6810719.1 biopolymer transport protein ExbD [Arcicella sp. BE140]MDR6822069.1 biopolymer transport protein ExbD [Arcicella sp. BE139]